MVLLTFLSRHFSYQLIFRLFTLTTRKLNIFTFQLDEKKHSLLLCCFETKCEAQKRQGSNLGKNELLNKKGSRQRANGIIWSSCILSVCWGHRSVCFIVQDRNKNDRSRNAKSIKVDALALNAFSHVWLFKTNNRDETLITFHTLWGTRYNHPMVDLDTCRPGTTPGVQTNTKTQHLFATAKSIKSRD